MGAGGSVHRGSGGTEPSLCFRDPPSLCFRPYAPSTFQIFSTVTLEISRADTPTLPWVLPYYALMIKTLDKTIKNTKISPKIREAVVQGQEKLLHYFEIAKKSNHTILATGMFSFCSITWSSRADILGVVIPACHPSLRVDWFHRLGPDMHARAQAIFQHVYQEYRSETTAASEATSAPSAPAPTPLQRSGSSFLAAAAYRPNARPPTAALTRPEHTRWVENEGSVSEAEEANPLLWWKVCPFSDLGSSSCR
jgi:hypothetical protein